MPLQLPEGSRFAKPSPEQALPFEFVNEICAAVGAPHVWSSDESWAYTDLHSAMRHAAQNPALFIQAFYDGCESLRGESELEIPSIDLLNMFLREHDVPYEVRPPRLLRLKGAATMRGRTAR